MLTKSFQFQLDHVENELLLDKIMMMMSVLY